MTFVELLERDGELRYLEGAWSDARAGSGSLVLVAGESGIGKTSLVRAFARGAAAGAEVLWGFCDPLTTPRPLGPLHDVGADLGDSLAVLVSSGAPAHEISTALLEALSARPVVLVIDDLQWADEATVDVLRFLLRRVSRTRSLVVATYRADDLDAFHPLRALAGDVARTPSATRLDLAPLSLGAVASLIGPRDLDPARLHRLTRGNSFFVTEIVGYDGDELPATVRDAVLARAAGLDTAARDLADLIACAPGAIPEALLPALGVGIASLRTLDAAGLIARDRRGVTYRHDISRLAIAGALPPGGEVSLHRRILEAFETQADPDPAVLAHHALGAGDGARVFRYAARAGRVAAGSGAHTEATRHFEQALDHAPESALGARAELCELLAMELYLTDRPAEAVAAAGRAAAWRRAEGNSVRASAAHQLLGVFEWYNGNRPAAEEHAATAVAMLDLGPDAATDAAGVLGHALAIQAFLAAQKCDLTMARDRHARALQLARGLADRKLDVRLATVESVIAMMSGDRAGRDRIVAVLDQDGEFYDEVHSSGFSNLANLDVEQRRLDAAQKVLDHCLPMAVQWDLPICYGWQRGVRGRLRMIRGAWEEARVDASAVLADSRAPLTHTWPLLVRGLVDLRRGEPDAQEHLEQGWDLAVRYGEPLRVLPAAAALAERSWLTGTVDARVVGAPALLAAVGSLPGTEWSAGELAVWLARVGVPFAPLALPADSPHRLLLDGDPQRAAEEWEQLSSPYDQALAMIDTGRSASAFAALEILDRLGADAVAAKVRRDLRERGVAGVPARPRETTRANPGGLTSRQVDVVRLLAEGLTNAEISARLFISEKTADHHVSAVLAKLDVRTRREAAAEARVLGLVPDRRRVPREAVVGRG